MNNFSEKPLAKDQKNDAPDYWTVAVYRALARRRQGVRSRTVMDIVENSILRAHEAGPQTVSASDLS